MVLKSFYLSILIRVTLIVLSGLIMGIIIQHLGRGYYYTLAGMIALIAVQTYLLVNQVNRTNADLEKFFSSIHDQDSSIRFSKSINDRSFVDLRKRMNDLNSTIQQIKIDNERNRQFLQSVVDHVDIGLLSFDQHERIEIYNKAATNFINVSRLSMLKSNKDEIYSILQAIKPGQELLYKLKISNQLQSVLIKATEVKFENQLIKLISFENISRELERKELDSWQRLIRVLTHEIMNSVSPITSLTSVISGYFKNKDNDNPVLPGEIDSRIILNTLTGLNTIEETGKGLLDFVDKYRSLSSLPKPKLSTFRIDSLFRSCKILMESNLPENISVIHKVYPPNLEMTADHSQVEQILINLIKNAAEVLNRQKDGIIKLTAFDDDGYLSIQVEDNGPGIPDAMLEDIFVPFYTTKENGSGIGLSISKQIMQNHNGTITVGSSPNQGAIFTLKFQ